MHVYYVHQHFSPPGGYGNNRSLEFCRRFVKDGFQVTVITSKANFPDLGFSCEDKNYIIHNIEGIRVVILNIRYSHFMHYTRRVRAFILFSLRAYYFLKRQSNIDLLYISSTPLLVGMIGIRMKKKYNLPFVFETVDLWPDVPVDMGIIKNRLLQFFLYRFERQIYQYAEAIITLSDGMREKLYSKGVPRNKVYTIYNGTNTDQFYPDTTDFALKRSLGFDHDDFIVIYAGTIGRANAVDFLIRVAACISDEGYDKIKFLIIGDGNRKSEVQKLARQLHTGNVVFKERMPVKDLNRVLQLASAGVVTFAPYPVLETNSANKFFDYLAAGLPVCINYKGWQATILKQYQCGLAASQNDLKGFADNLLTLYNRPDMLYQFQRNARKPAVNLFDRKMLAGQLEHVLLQFKK